MSTSWLDSIDFSFTFSHALNGSGSASHEVYVKGKGPPILILQELPGIGQETFDLADRLIAEGFRVYLPHLLGRLGSANRLTTTVNFLRLLCIRREFNVFLTGKQSPIAAWMRALTAEVKVREGSEIGVIGMCLTGSFVIPLMAEDAVKGAVASQPALPMRNRDELHMSQDDVDRACAAMNQKGGVLAMRYTRDPISSEKHMAALKRAFGDHLETDEDESQGKMDHSMLTLDFSEKAFQRTLTYFQARFGIDA